MGCWSVGDAIEVMHYSLADGATGWEESPRIITEWVPATVVGIDPLSVAFSDGTRLALHPRSGYRKPQL